MEMICFSRVNGVVTHLPPIPTGSPVWKPRDVFGGGGGRGESQTLPRPGKGGGGREDHFLVYEEYGGNIYTSSSKKDTGSTKTLHC